MNSTQRDMSEKFLFKILLVSVVYKKLDYINYEKKVIKLLEEKYGDIIYSNEKLMVDVLENCIIDEEILDEIYSKIKGE